MAQAAGVKLGHVLVIEPASAEPFRPRVFAAPMAKRVAAPAAMPVEAGSQQLSADVSVSWAIDQP